MLSEDENKRFIAQFVIGENGSRKELTVRSNYELAQEERNMATGNDWAVTNKAKAVSGDIPF